MRLSRRGAKKRPYYHIVIADRRAPRDGRFVTRIGSYNPLLPKDSPDRVKLDVDAAKEWIAKGAKPTDRVARFLDAVDVLKRAPRNNPKKGQPGQKARERAEALTQDTQQEGEAADEADKADKVPEASEEAADTQKADS